MRGRERRDIETAVGETGHDRDSVQFELVLL